MAYLDHAATTPVRPEAREAMLPWLGDRVGNPSGSHALARSARRALDDARDVFASATGFPPGDIVFTSGGTEADNLAISGLCGDGTPVCSAVEHHAVLDVVGSRHGRLAPVGADGQIDLDALAPLLDDSVSVVSVMAVNNETGIVTDLDPVIDLVRERSPNAVIHTDAVQAAACLDLVPLLERVDAVSLSAHKIGGPQGVGVLAVREGLKVAPALLGGGQERGRRPGTQNVAGVCGAAAAMAATIADRPQNEPRIRALRDRLVSQIVAAVDDVIVTAALAGGEPAPTVATHAHLCFPGVDGEALLLLLEDRDVFASAASSCSSGAQQSSHVLTAMGLTDGAAGSLRLSLGWSSDDADVDAAIDAIIAAVERVRMFA